MVCPFCLHKKTEVYNSRKAARLNANWRRRRCLSCGREFTTYETADPSSILQIKQSKRIIPFSSMTLLLSILRACDHRTDTDRTVPYLCETIQQSLYKTCAETNEHWISKELIIATTADTLQHFDAAAYVKYMSHYEKQDAPTIRRALRRKK